MRGQTQLDLAVVGREQHVARIGDERVADFAPDLGPDRDVLQIGVVRGQAAGLRTGQRETGVDAARLGVDHRLERVGVSRFQLGQLAPVEHQRRALHALAREPLEFVDVGRILAALALAAAFQPEPAVEHFAELLRTADGERPAGRLVDALLELRDLLGEFAAETREIVAVNTDSAPLHASDDVDQRLVDPLVDRRDILLSDARLETLPQP